jgi:hypothetical protein
MSTASSSPITPREAWSLRRSTRPAAAFEDILPRVGLRFPLEAVDVPTALTIEGEGTWTLSVSGGRAHASEGRSDDAHLHIAMTRGTWKAAVGGRLRDATRQVVEPLGWLDAWPATDSWVLDAEQAAALRLVEGVLACVVRDRDYAEDHRFVLGLGRTVDAQTPADVSLTIDLDPLAAFAASRPGPRELRRLVTGGDVRVDGDLALPSRLLAAVLPQ